MGLENKSSKVTNSYNNKSNNNKKNSSPNNNNTNRWEMTGNKDDNRVRCYACQKPGHFARDCKSKRAHPNEAGSSGNSTGLSN